jgi:hypothetical protein
MIVGYPATLADIELVDAALPGMTLPPIDGDGLWNRSTQGRDSKILLPFSWYSSWWVVFFILEERGKYK